VYLPSPNISEQSQPNFNDELIGMPLVQAVRRDITVNYAGWQLGIGGEEVPMVTIDAYDFVDVSLLKVHQRITAAGPTPSLAWPRGNEPNVSRHIPLVAREFSFPSQRRGFVAFLLEGFVGLQQTKLKPMIHRGPLKTSSERSQNANT
jgi:hypothetical protein